MKSSILGAVLALAMIACVEPAPEPQLVSTEQASNENVLAYCVTAGPVRCIIVPLILGNASQQCHDMCVAAGFPSPRVIFVQESPCIDF